MKDVIELSKCPICGKKFISTPLWVYKEYNATDACAHTIAVERVKD